VLVANRVRASTRQKNERVKRKGRRKVISTLSRRTITWQCLTTIACSLVSGVSLRGAHVHVQIAHAAGAWDLHIFDFDSGRYDPAELSIPVALAARSTIPGNPLYAAFLGRHAKILNMKTASEIRKETADFQTGSQQGPPIIRIERLSVEYRNASSRGERRMAINNLSLAVGAGEVFGFLGPNGAGKTTTMNVLLGFTSATRGGAFLFGTNVRDPIARQRIGYLPELAYYYKFLTGEELLRFYARIFKIPKPERERRIDSVLKLVELKEAGQSQIKTYSKGMQQRVGLAQALINNPDLLMLDEPTSGLDPLGRMKVRRIIQRLKNEGKTVFFSSHELGEVETVCDRVAIMHQGQLRVEGRLDELARQHECNLEQLFLRIVGNQPESSDL